MKPQSFYFTGYHKGWSLVHLEKVTRQNNLLVADIRLVPNSPNPDWRYSALEKALGERYRNIRGLGNRNYQTGFQVAYFDLAGGVDDLLAFTEGGQGTIILCACKAATTCHRTDLKARLENYLPDIEMLEISADHFGGVLKQLKMF